MRKEDVKQIEAFEMWIWRRMERISWTEHRVNEEVLKKGEEKRSLIDIIRTKQKNWIGHILGAVHKVCHAILGKFCHTSRDPQKVSHTSRTPPPRFLVGLVQKP